MLLSPSGRVIFAGSTLLDDIISLLPLAIEEFSSCCESFFFDKSVILKTMCFFYCKKPQCANNSTSSIDSLENLNTTEAVNAILLFLRSSFAGEEVFGVPLDPNFFSDVPYKVNLILDSSDLL